MKSRNPIAALVQRTTLTASTALARRRHRQDIDRYTSLRIQLNALRSEEQHAILAAIDSGRRLAECEAQLLQLEIPA